MVTAGENQGCDWRGATGTTRSRLMGRERSGERKKGRLEGRCRGQCEMLLLRVGGLIGEDVTVDFLGTNALAATLLLRTSCNHVSSNASLV